MSTSIAARKARGRSFQQAVRDKILAAFPELEPDDVRSTSMGSAGVDLQLSPAARKLLKNLMFECKNQVKLDLHDWLRQAAAHGSGIPVVAFKTPKKAHPLILMDIDEFLKLLKEK